MVSKKIERIFSYPTVGVDPNVFIYALEDNKDFPEASEFFRQLPKKGPTVYTSILTVLEAVVPLYRAGEERRIPDYIDFIGGQGLITIVEINRTIALKSAELRAKYKLKTPDAIQLATAIVKGAGAFITADRDFKFDEIENIKIERI